MSNYYEWEGFECLYLEDSYVLGIAEKTNSIFFSVEVVLTDSHSLYKEPCDGEQYCYMRGKIIFDQIKVCSWINRGLMELVDSEDNIDYGNIDSFRLDENKYKLSGDWGELEVVSSPVRFSFE